MHVVARLNPSATRNQHAKNAPYDITCALSGALNNARKLKSPAKPNPEPRAKICRSCVRRAKRRLRNKKGKIVTPPRAMKFPAANGDQWNGERGVFDVSRVRKGECLGAKEKSVREDAEGDSVGGAGPAAPGHRGAHQ